MPRRKHYPLNLGLRNKNPQLMPTSTRVASNLAFRKPSFDRRVQSTWSFLTHSTRTTRTKKISFADASASLKIRFCKCEPQSKVFGTPGPVRAFSCRAMLECKCPQSRCPWSLCRFQGIVDVRANLSQVTACVRILTWPSPLRAMRFNLSQLFPRESGRIVTATPSHSKKPQKATPSH